jgi:hypothetical protein
LQTNKILPGLNALALLWQVATIVKIAATLESQYSLVLFPLAVAVPFGIGLYSMLRPPKLRLLAIVTNALLVGIALLVLLPVFTVYGFVHYVGARVVEGNVAWIFTALFWALDITVAVCNLIHFRQPKAARSGDAAI